MSSMIGTKGVTKWNFLIEKPNLKFAARGLFLKIEDKKTARLQNCKTERLKDWKIERLKDWKIERRNR